MYDFLLLLFSISRRTLERSFNVTTKRIETAVLRNEVNGGKEKKRRSTAQCQSEIVSLLVSSILHVQLIIKVMFRSQSINGVSFERNNEAVNVMRHV